MNVPQGLIIVTLTQYVQIQLEVMNVIVNQVIMEMELNVFHVMKMNIHLITQHVFLVLKIQQVY